MAPVLVTLNYRANIPVGEVCRLVEALPTIVAEALHVSDAPAYHVTKEDVVVMPIRHDAVIPPLQVRIEMPKIPGLVAFRANQRCGDIVKLLRSIGLPRDPNDDNLSPCKGFVWLVFVDGELHSF